MSIIALNTATAAQRRIYFTLVDSSDLITPKDISVTGVKGTLSFNGATPVTATNDIVKVSGTWGWYYQELTQSESNTGLGTVVFSIQPTGCAIAQREATIGPAESYSSPATSLPVSAGGITSASFAAGAIDAAATSADFITEVQSGLATASAVSALPSATAIADALLARSQKGGSNTAPTVSQALASGLMLIDITAGVLTVKHGDGTTAFTRTLTRAALNAIISAV